MALSCMIGKVSSPAAKAQFLKHLSNLLVRPSSAVHVTRLSFHQKLTTSDNQSKELCGLTQHPQLPPSIVNAVKQFSTSPARSGDHKDHDHSKIWSLERVLAVLLLPLTPAALLIPCQALDTVLALLMVVHTHFGLEAIVVDYLRPILFGDLVPKIGLGLLYVLSILTFAGLLNLIYNDIGLANTIISVWKK